MKRCSVRLYVTSTSPDTTLIQESVKQHLSNAIYLTTITHIEHVDNMLLIEIETEGTPQDIAAILKELGTKSGVKSLEVGWGWLSTASNSPDNHLVLINGDDPLFLVHTQTEKIREYRGEIGQVLLLILALTGLLVGGYLVLTGQIFIGLVLCLLFGIGIVIDGLAFAYGLIHQVATIKIDHNGVIFRFWLRPPVHLIWEDLCGIRIRCLRHGLWCHILTCHATALPIVFPITQFYAIGEGVLIIKTIIERAALRFVEASGFSGGELTNAAELGSILYKRFDAKK